VYTVYPSESCPLKQVVRMHFERDVFISYAHIDNLPLKEGEKGWVEDFHRALDVRLAQLKGERSNIWRDPKLQGNDFFGDEILRQFPKTAVMISILSPRYIKSEWCNRELKEFIEAASKGVGTKIDSKSRIFKLVKTAVPYDAHPPEIAETLGYEFFVIDPDTGRSKELSPKAEEELEQKYWAKLDDIAHDICDLLERLETTGETGERKRDGQLTVYLAETSSDLKEQRDIVKRELLELGYNVLPDFRLPAVESEFRQSMEDLLAQCVLSVHMVGRNYGPVPEGTQKSIVVLQNEQTVEKCKTGKLRRLIWLLPGSDTEIDDERQKQFLRLIRTDADAQYGADLFETSIENFKYAIHDKLKSIQSALAAEKEKKTAPAGSVEGPPLVYLICARGDLDAVSPVEDFLYESEFDVLLPAFEGDENRLIEDHRENLKSCDAVLIYYGEGNELWMRSIARDLTKIAGYGRTRPLHAKVVYLAAPASRSKERFRSHGTLIVNGMQGFSPPLLEPFVEIVKAVTK